MYKMRARRIIKRALRIKDERHAIPDSKYGRRNRMCDCDDFISVAEPLSRSWQKEAVLRRVHPTRVRKGRAVTPRDRSQSNVSATFRFHVAVCRMHKGLST